MTLHLQKNYLQFYRKMKSAGFHFDILPSTYQTAKVNDLFGTIYIIAGPLT